MTIYENNKRVVSRGITFIDDDVLLIERHRKENDEILHYFTIPGGGVEDGEDYVTASIRETEEETGVKTKLIKYLTREDYGSGICYWHHLEYLSGIPQLGGEELEKNNDDNHYKVVLININDIDNINILGIGKDLIKKSYEEYKNRSNN